MIMKFSSFLWKLRQPTLLLCVVTLLTGCFGAVVAGAGAGVLMFSDRRLAEVLIADEGVEGRSAVRIIDKYGDKIHVNVTAYNGMALLTGEVPSQAIKMDIEKIVSEVPNVKTISNELAIAGTSSLGGRSNDAYITSKVKARFIDANKFAPHHVKVVTEAGVVFLLGLVTQAEANAAVEIARTTGGVQKVIRVMEIITPEQAKALDPKPAPRDSKDPYGNAPSKK